MTTSTAVPSRGLLIIPLTYKELLKGEQKGLLKESQKRNLWSGLLIIPLTGRC